MGYDDDYDDGWDFDYRDDDWYDDDDTPGVPYYGGYDNHSGPPVVTVLLALVFCIFLLIVGSFFVRRKTLPTPDNLVRVVVDGALYDLPEMAKKMRQIDSIDQEFWSLMEQIGQSGSMTLEEVANLANQEVGICGISKAFPPNVYRWCDLITKYSRAVGLNPNLVAALITVESGGNPTAYSHSGAVGLMQIMASDGIAATFVNSAGVPYFADRPTTSQLKDPEFNIKYGTKFLAGLVQRRGSLREALKSYGPMDYGYKYADLVLATMKKYT